MVVSPIEYNNFDTVMIIPCLVFWNFITAENQAISNPTTDIFMETPTSDKEIAAIACFAKYFAEIQI